MFVLCALPDPKLNERFGTNDKAVNFDCRNEMLAEVVARSKWVLNENLMAYVMVTLWHDKSCLHVYRVTE